MDITTRTYTISPSTSVEEIDQLTREAWRELLRPTSLLRKEAKGIGIPVESFKGDFEDYFVLQQKEAPSGIGEMQVIWAAISAAATAAAPAVGRMAWQLWNQIIIPYLKRKTSEDAIKESDSEAGTPERGQSSPAPKATAAVKRRKAKPVGKSASAKRASGAKTSPRRKAASKKAKP